MKTSIVAALAACSVALVAACNTPPKDPNVDDNRKEVKADPLASTATPADPKKMPVAEAGSEAPITTASAPPAASAAPAAGDAGITGSKSSACKTDADCRTFSSYCAESPCACRVLSKGDPDPTCVGAGPKVQCLVNPCGQKAAHCESNVCVLVGKQAAGASTK